MQSSNVTQSQKKLKTVSFLGDLEAMDEKQIDTMSIQDAETLTIFSTFDSFCGAIAEDFAEMTSHCSCKAS